MSNEPASPAKPRLRVVLVVNSVRRGGAETQLVRVALGLASRGHDVRVLTFLDREGWQAELATAGVPLIHLPTSSPVDGPVTVARAVRLCRRIRPDALVGFDYQPSIAVRLVGRLAGVPVVVSSIRNEDLGGGRLREASVRLTDPLATVTTTNSRRVAASLLERRLVSAARLDVVANGLDTSSLTRPAGTREAVRVELAVPDATFLWLSVSYLRREKDVGTLISAVEILRDRRRPDFQVIVAGDGALLSELKAEAEVRSLSRHIRFLGRRSDVADLLAAADAFVLSSRAEGLPNAVMEAMAARLPVVASSVGGIPELVREGVHGRLVPPGSPRELAEAMVQITRMDADARAEMGDAARSVIETGYALPRLVDRWEQLLLDRVSRAERAGARARAGPAPAGAR